MAKHIGGTVLPGKPFFSIFNFNVTHESQVFGPTGKRNLRFQEGFPEDESLVNVRGQLDSSEWVLKVPEKLNVPIPPYLPNTPPVLADVRRVYSNIVEMDKQVGYLLNQLEADGLLDNTIIVWYTDHGGPLPRQKRLLYDSGIHVPMIIRFPDGRGAGTIDSQLVSFVDMAPTTFSLAGIQPPAYVQGKAFLGPYQETEPRKYVYAAADRLDTEYDQIRAVRDKRYKYLRNYKPNRPYYLEVKYRERMNSMKELLRLNKAGKLNEYQQQWFRATKPEEELFDTWSDPHELKNIAEHPDYRAKLEELRAANNAFVTRVHDLGNLSEKELIEQMWGSLEQPQTAGPEVKQLEDDRIQLTCSTVGARIGYQILDHPDDSHPSWEVYTEPIKCPRGKILRFVGHRIGYQPSDQIDYKKT